MEQVINSKQDALDLLNEIKTSLERDVGLVTRQYLDYYNDTGTGVGFFAIPRLIFPEIDNLGCYLAGTTENTGANAIAFMKKYFSITNPEYASKSSFIYIIYRHGLMHQHTPKILSYRGKNIGWQINLSEHGESSHLRQNNNGSVIIDGRQFLDDIFMAIEKYKTDIKNNVPDLLLNMQKAHSEMMNVLDESVFLRKGGVASTDLDFLK